MAVLHYNFHTHPKIAQLPKATIGVYALALSYCSANLTDGFIPTSYARQLDAKRQHFGRLTAAGLLAKRPDGYQVHDYLDYNPTKIEVEAKRLEAKERMKRVRANRGGKKPEGSREQKRAVLLNVHDIGKDNPLNVKSKPSTTASSVDGDEVAAKRAELEAAAKFAGVNTIGASLEAFLDRFHEEAASG